MRQDSFCQAPSVLSKEIGSMGGDDVHPIRNESCAGTELHEDEDDEDIPHRNECGYLGQANIDRRYEDGRDSQKEPGQRKVVMRGKAQCCKWYGNQIDKR